jgi:hypothetical protein
MRWDNTGVWYGECADRNAALVAATLFAAQDAASIADDTLANLSVWAENPVAHPDWPPMVDIRQWYWDAGVRGKHEAWEAQAALINHRCTQIDTEARKAFDDMTRIILDKKNLGTLDFPERSFLDWMAWRSKSFETAEPFLGDLRILLADHLTKLALGKYPPSPPSETPEEPEE